MSLMSRSSGTRLQATRPIEPRLRKALIRSLAGSMIYSRKPWKFASPADPASTSVVTPRSAPHSEGRIEISVPPCQIWTCRSTQPGEIQAPLPSIRSTSARTFNDLPMALILPSFPTRISVVVSECSAPKATGLTLVMRSGFACSPEIILQIPSQSWIEHVA